MKLFIGILLCFLVLEVNSQSWFQSMKEAGQGTRDLWGANRDMTDANWKTADKYFQPQRDYVSALRGANWAARVISDATRNTRRGTDRGTKDSQTDQSANERSRSGRDPNRFPPRLPFGRF